MTDPTQPWPLSPVDVVGQRQLPGGGFPYIGMILKGDGPGPQIDLQPGDTPPIAVEPTYNPCADSVMRKIWNADAAAAAAVAALMAKAASLNDGSNLGNREFGANLFLSGSGQVGLTEIDVGPLAVVGDTPEVEILPHGTTYLSWVGDIHNHPSGDGKLSFNERILFNARIDKMIDNYPSRTEALSIAAYVVVLDPNAPHGYRIFAHTRQAALNELGKEVNPDAQPCPAE